MKEIEIKNELLEEQKKTNELLQRIIDDKEKDFELLTIEQVHEEFDIGVQMVRKMFKDPKLPVQKYTIPFKVTRGALKQYMQERHDYLCERS